MIPPTREARREPFHAPYWMRRLSGWWWKVVPHRWVSAKPDVSKRSLFNWCARCGGSYPTKR